MRKILSISIGIIFLSIVTFVQNAAQVLDLTEYFKKIQKADSLFNAKQFQASTQEYSKAFLSIGQGFSLGHKFQAARAWAKVKNKDSAITNLEREAWGGYTNYKRLISERLFKFLKTDPRWAVLSNKVKENQIQEDKKLGIYKPIKEKLEEILIMDQKYRQSYMDKWKQYGLGSKQLTSIDKKMTNQDRSNLTYVAGIIDRYGWISYDTIGFEANQTLFLVIQHADSLTQEKYLPVMRQAVRQNRAKGYDLALLEDRVLIRRGEKQIYGTQVRCDDSGLKCWVLPIVDEKNVDTRRMQIGLQPLALYLKSYGIDYKLQE